MANPEYEDISSFVKFQVLKQFEIEIKFKVLRVYRQYINRLRARQDKNEILTVLNMHTNNHLLLQIEGNKDLETLHLENTSDGDRLLHKFEKYEQQVNRFLKLYQVFSIGNQNLKQKIQDAKTKLE